jgi:hypothetical protein
LGIENGQTVKQALVDALARFPELTLDLAGAEGVDVTFLQMVCAVHRGAADKGASIVCLANRPPFFDDTLRRAGLDAVPPERCGLSECLFASASGASEPPEAASAAED